MFHDVPIELRSSIYNYYTTNYYTVIHHYHHYYEIMNIYEHDSMFWFPTVSQRFPPFFSALGFSKVANLFTRLLRKHHLGIVPTSQRFSLLNFTLGRNWLKHLETC